MKTVYAAVIRDKAPRASESPSIGDIINIDIDGSKQHALVESSPDLSCTGCVLYKKDHVITCPVKIDGLLVCGSIRAIFKPVETMMEDI